MKTFAKLFATASIALATASAAHATPVSGAITIAGNDTYNATSINFNPSTGAVTSATGSLSMFAPVLNSNGTITNFAAALTSFAFASANTAPGVTVFNVGNGTAAASFTITSLQSYIGPLGALSLSGSGYFTETGYSQTMGDFSLTSSTTGVTGFQLTTSVTPEPSSLILLGTGLVCAAGMMFARRRQGLAL